MTCKKAKSSDFNLDFAIVGCQKSGTTWLHNCLSQSAEIGLPQHIKEVNYFNKNYSRGYQWYSSHFRDNALVRGEASPEYIVSEEAMIRLRRDYPDVKVILILRRPFSRSIAHFRHIVRTRGFEGSFSQALNYYPEIESWSAYKIQIERLTRIFPSENILILVFEQMINSQLETLQAVGKFIGLDDVSGLQPVDEKYEFYIPRFPKVYSVLRIAGSVFREIGLQRVVATSKDFVVRILGKSSRPYPNLSDEELNLLKSRLANDETYVKKLLKDRPPFWIDN